MIRTEHNEATWKFPFIAYQAQAKGKKLPLIILLHGAGERGCGREELKRIEKYSFWEEIKDDTAHECMIVAPQCPENSFWAAHVESILQFIEQLKAAYPIDDDRVYLTGLSMGGYGTWFTAMERPDLFAAIVPVCGGGMAWNAGVLTMPVWAFHGDADVAVSVRQSDEMVESMRAKGLDVKYSRLEGVDHNAWDYAYNMELLEWLLSKKRG